MNNPINAAPMTLGLGTQDLSTRQVPVEPAAYPQHLPKFYIFAAKGETTPQLVVGASRVSMYGDDTFDPKKPYYTHVTEFANQVNNAANMCMLQRLKPLDAGPDANVTLWLDVLETEVDIWRRNEDGSIFYDTTGQKVSDGKTQGYSVKYVVDSETTVNDFNTKFGKVTVKAGSQSDGVKTSQRYAIMSIPARAFGAYYNTVGFRISAPTLKTADNMPERLMSEEKVYPYSFTIVRKPNDFASPQKQLTVMGESEVTFVLKEGVADPISGQEMYVKNVVPHAWENTTDPRYGLKYSDIGTPVIHEGNIAMLSEMFHAAETPFITHDSDFSEDPDTMFLFNLIGFENSKGNPYTAVQLVDDNDAVVLDQYNTFYMSGGSDGTMNNATLNSLVQAEMDKYLDPNDEVQDMAYNVESIMYDSGFEVETKYKLAYFISVRRDTFVALSTYIDGQPAMSPSEEYSLAISLKTRLQAYPESVYYGTKTARGLVMGRSCKVRNSQYKGRLPLTIELAIKAATMMGAANGKWNTTYKFDSAPGSILENVYDVSVPWVPATVRNRNWDAGLNFPLRYDRERFFFPALKTVYEDDTSVLTSFFTAMAICYINKVTEAVWREMTGNMTLTRLQFVDKTNSEFSERVKDKFGGIYTVIPEAMFTEKDATRGFSWTLPVSIYAPNMKTVMTTYVKAYRDTDLEG